MKKKLLISLSLLQICAGILMILFGLQEKKVYYIIAITLFFLAGIINLLYLFLEKKSKN